MAGSPLVTAKAVTKVTTVATHKVATTVTAKALTPVVVVPNRRSTTLVTARALTLIAGGGHVGQPKLTAKGVISVNAIGSHYEPDGIGYELYEMFGPLVERFGDPRSDLLNLCRGLGRMLQPLDDIVKDGPLGEPGYSQVLDLNRAKDEWLPWLGQVVGYQVTARVPTEDLATWSVRERSRMISRSAHRRGTVARMVEAVQEQLIAPQTVVVQQRTTSAHRISLFYYVAQLKTSSSVAIVNALAQEQKAKGLILTVVGLTGGDWNTLTANSATWNIVVTKFASWNEVISNPAKP